jgi:hypothetical protein
MGVSGLLQHHTLFHKHTLSEKRKPEFI